MSWGPKGRPCPGEGGRLPGRAAGAVKSLRSLFCHAAVCEQWGSGAVTAGEQWGSGAVAAVSLPAWLLSAVPLFGFFHWCGKDPGREAEPAIQTPASISFSVLGS